MFSLLKVIIPKRYRTLAGKPLSLTIFPTCAGNLMQIVS
jgi:hypothetical protein